LAGLGVLVVGLTGLLVPAVHADVTGQLLRCTATGTIQQGANHMPYGEIAGQGTCVDTNGGQWAASFSGYGEGAGTQFCDRYPVNQVTAQPPVLLMPGMGVDMTLSPQTGPVVVQPEYWGLGLPSVLGSGEPGAPTYVAAIRDRSGSTAGVTALGSVVAVTTATSATCTLSGYMGQPVGTVPADFTFMLRV
jgi:hypothetical protein